MDKNEALIVAKRYLNEISKRYPIEHAILFGSFAKGTNRVDSDIDLALVFRQVDDIVDMQIELLCMRTDDDLLIEPHPFKDSDFNIANPLVAEILKEGIAIKDFA